MLVAFDLDDTLFAEADFVESAYRAIASRYGAELLPLMKAAPSPAAAFDATGLPIDRLLDIYRRHMPDIRLALEVRRMLANLSDAGHRLAIVTDGRSVTQRNKIRALGLDRLVAPRDIFISEEVGADKLSGEAFVMLDESCPAELPKIYVADNPAKDFLIPNRLNWRTVCLLNCGRNIHPQQFESVEARFRPSEKISSLAELPELVNKFERLKK